MKNLHHYIPFFGMILIWIEDSEDFNYKNPHFWATGLFHGCIWGQILAG
jgi:hypothetical protein